MKELGESLLGQNWQAHSPADWAAWEMWPYLGSEVSPNLKPELSE